MNKIIGKIGVLMLVSAFMAMSAVSCRKKGDTIAKITIVDTSGTEFSGAMVRLYPEPTIDVHGAITIDDTIISGIDGVATFNFTDKYNLGQAGVFVLNIEVRSGDTLTGSGIIKVEQEETSQETVIIQ